MARNTNPSERFRRRLGYRGGQLTKRLRSLLVTRDHIATGRLHKSIKTKVTKESANRYSLTLYSLKYGEYLNSMSGDGGRVKWRPPFQALAAWATRKGIQPRGSGGKDAFKRMIYAIQNHIEKTGFMRPKSGKKHQKGWIDEAKSDTRNLLIEHFSSDMHHEVDYIIKNSFKGFGKKK
jgi:hypothetical protein